MKRTCPELLAPAGDWDSLRAAVENGADAVYFGLSEHNARARATNFALHELPEIMRFLRERGVRGYVTLNTLLFSHELPRAEEMIRAMTRSGVDAAIVQDLGVARLARAISPELRLHASTQMTLTSAESMEWAAELGIARVVLARELSLDEIARLRRQTDLPIEVFVHGALCVAYSGQCLTSEALGGRSANRGQCAQACRLPYELIVDGEVVDLGDRRYLLSPRDLAGYEELPALIELGVASLKIEGRLKSPDYVANITRHYRDAIDQAMVTGSVDMTQADVEEMQLSFSRGFSSGWLRGNDHQRLVNAECPTKRGVLLGEILSVRGQRVTLDVISSLRRGDGVVFDRGHPEEPEEGGRVYEIFLEGRSIEEAVSTGRVELTFGHGAIDWSRVAPGQRLWKTDDPRLHRRLARTYQGPSGRRLPLRLFVNARVGEPLKITALTPSGLRAESQVVFVPSAAQKRPLTLETLKEQLGRLGKTPFELASIQAEIVGAPMVPWSVLGHARHELVDQLTSQLAHAPDRPLAPEGALELLRQRDRGVRADGIPSDSRPELATLCRSIKQVETAINHADRIYVDFADIREYARAIQLARAASIPIYLATPRVQKPSEAPLFKYLCDQRPDGLLAQNLGAARYALEQNLPCVVDFSLNVANDLTAQWFIDRGVTRITPSFDLDRDQLLDLMGRVPATWFEVVAHQHMPMFHMEHCVFCACLSTGHDRTDCGRPCDRHEVKLRDRVGKEHALKADVGCRNTLFNAVPQSAAEIVPALLDRGVRYFRIDFLDESPADVIRAIQLYRRLIAGELSGRTVWSTLNAIGHVGVTRGPLEILNQ